MVLNICHLTKKKNLIKLIEGLHKKTEDQHKLFTQSIDDIKTDLGKLREETAKQTVKLVELQPVAEVYQSFTGAGKLMKGFLTWVVFPASAVIGLYFGIKSLFK